MERERDEKRERERERVFAILLVFYPSRSPFCLRWQKRGRGRRRGKPSGPKRASTDPTGRIVNRDQPERFPTGAMTDTSVLY